MKKRTPEIKVPGKFDPQLRWLLIYFVTTLVVLWVWQELFRQFAVVTIPYSEFKSYVSRHEVTEASIQLDEIVGQIVPRASSDATAPDVTGKPAGEGGAGVSPSPKQTPADARAFFFRTVRVEDPDLVNELQAAGVKYTGTRPSVSRSSSWPGCCLFLSYSACGHCFPAASRLREKVFLALVRAAPS